MTPRQSELSVVDLFCGAGGLSQGFSSAGFRVLAGTDHDPDAMATYRANFPGARGLTGDVRASSLREELAEYTTAADVIVGGPPCQAFSQVRNHSRLISDPRNSLYREFVRTLGGARPKAFVMENVPGLAQMGALEQVERDLSLDGDYLVTPQIVDAADFGVPQTRKRLLFIGIRADLGIQPPILIGSGASRSVQLVRKESLTGKLRYVVSRREDVPDSQSLLQRLEDPKDLSAVSARQAISDLTALDAGRREDTMGRNELGAAESAFQRLMRQDAPDYLSNVSVPRCMPDTEMRLLGIPAGGNHRDLPDELRARYLSDTRWGPSNGTGRLGRAHYYAYRRLHPSLWAWTLNTKGDSAYHYSKARCLSVREFARLQSFPDRFVFLTDGRKGPLDGRISGGAAHSRYRQAGNAVPPLLAQCVATAVAGSLAGVGNVPAAAPAA